MPADWPAAWCGVGFGAARLLVMELLWVYLSAQILLVGAAFTCAYARTFGSHKTADT